IEYVEGANRDVGDARDLDAAGQVEGRNRRNFDWNCAASVRHAASETRAGSERKPATVVSRTAARAKMRWADRKSTRLNPVTNVLHVCRLLLEKKNIHQE